MKAPSDAQAALLASVQAMNDEGREVEWRTGLADGHLPSRAELIYVNVGQALR